MKVVTAEEMREIDRITIKNYGISGNCPYGEGRACCCGENKGII